MALSDLRGVLTADAFNALEDAEKELYTERDGSFELTGIQGVKSEADVRRLQGSLEKERGDHKSAREKLKVWGDMDHEDIMGRLDRIPELEAAAADKIDEAKLEEMAESRALTRLKPVERENLRLTRELTERDTLISEFQSKEENRIISDALRSAGTDLKMLDPDDAVTFGRAAFRLSEEGEVITDDGLKPEQYLLDLQARKGHLWAPSVGGGATGGSAGGGFGGGRNPWSAEGWNMTEQSRVYNEHGPERARAMAKAAGTVLGGAKPDKK